MASNFKGNCLIVEEARSRRKPRVRSNPHSRPHVIKKSSENENAFPRNNFVSGDVTYADTAKSAKRSLTGHTQNRIVIFGDSIICSLDRDFNRELNTDYAKIRTFPGTTSKEFPHYVTPTLEEGDFDIAILHFGVNDTLQNRNRSEAQDK